MGNGDAGVLAQRIADALGSLLDIAPVLPDSPEKHQPLSLYRLGGWCLR